MAGRGGVARHGDRHDGCPIPASRGDSILWSLRCLSRAGRRTRPREGRADPRQRLLRGRGVLRSVHERRWGCASSQAIVMGRREEERRNRSRPGDCTTFIPQVAGIPTPGFRASSPWGPTKTPRRRRPRSASGPTSCSTSWARAVWAWCGRRAARAGPPPGGPEVIKAGMDTPQVVARFEAERQALALMDHRHIARVLDGAPPRRAAPTSSWSS